MSLRTYIRVLIIGAAIASGNASASFADFTSAAFKLSVAESVQGDRDISDFYKETGYEPLWIGRDREDRARRTAFLDFLETAEFHGLPAIRYDVRGLRDLLDRARSQADLAEAEAAFTKTYLKFARDIQTGVLVPSRIDEQIVRKVPYRERKSYLTALAQSTPAAFFRALPPSSPEYARLATERVRLQNTVRQGGWGPIVEDGEKLRLGDTGRRVIQLRDRLIAMGYLENTYSNAYDNEIEAAVIRFQENHGLLAGGVAGNSTIGMINVSARERLKSVVVAMERERWTNMDRGQRHVLVNLADFNVRIYDNDKVTFQTRSVVGHQEEERRSPEFSDEIEHMIINPTWNVPRSIATKEYLPMLQEDNFALDYLDLFDQDGAIVERFGLDFNAFTEEDFPFDMKQAPSTTNALGLVKYMFPNGNNIYLHDTPAKSLFWEEKRAFSHGCIRLQDPFEFGYALLAVQTDDPEGVFHTALDTGEETQINLDVHVPVHIIYRTAVGSADGVMGYRRDVYGRDAKIWEALAAQGVELGV